MFSVPPYCGVPRLSHQFPLAVVVVVFTEVVVVVVVEDAVGVLVVDVVFVGVEVGVEVWVDVLQDAKTKDATIRKVSTIQIVPFFNETSLNI